MNKSNHAMRILTFGVNCSKYMVILYFISTTFVIANFSDSMLGFFRMSMNLLS